MNISEGRLDHLEERSKRLTEVEKENELLKHKNRWAKLDIAELVNDFGVHPLFWNGAHQACLNGGNVPVEWFKSKQECHDWCDSRNKGATETPSIEIAELKHREWHWMQAFEEEGYDSHSMRDSECMYGDECPGLKQ